MLKNILSNAIPIFREFEKKHKIKLFFQVLAISLTNALDLIGILLVGLLVYSNFQQSSTTLIKIPGYDLFVVSLGLTNVGKLVFAIIVIFISKSLLGLWASKSLFNFLAERNAEISTSILKNLLNIQDRRYENTSSQELSTLTTFGSQAAIFDLLGYSAIALSEIVLILLISIMLVFLMPLIGILVLLYFLFITFFLNQIIGAKSKKMEAVNKIANIKSVELIQFSIHLKQEISLYSKLRYFIDNFNRIFGKQTKAISSLQFLGIMPKYLLEPFLIIGALLIGSVSYYFSNGQNLILQMTIVLTAATRLMPSFLRLQSSLTQISRSFALTPKVRQILEVDLTESECVSESQSENDSEVAVVAQNVSFSFPDSEKSIIKDLSFIIYRNRIFAIAGKSGSGKTTLINLILGFLRPSKGKLFVNTLNSSVFPKLAMVPQFPQFIPGSIVENVAFGVPSEDIDIGLVEKSLIEANIFDHVKSLPNGIYENIGESFKKFSGGQRQRVNIARALYSVPDIIVFDEPTSALDNVAKAHFIDLIRQLSISTTIVVVSHDEDLVRNCDHILRLD